MRIFDEQRVLGNLFSPSLFSLVALVRHASQEVSIMTTVADPNGGASTNPPTSESKTRTFGSDAVEHRAATVGTIPTAAVGDTHNTGGQVADTFDYPAGPGGKIDKGHAPTGRQAADERTAANSEIHRDPTAGANGGRQHRPVPRQGTPPGNYVN